MNFYCISVRTGMEEKYNESMHSLLEADGKLKGSFYFLKKQMRLKTGKEYFDPFFPGYVFFKTEENDLSKLRILEKGKGFQHFLPSNQNITPLVMNDLKIVKSILSFGSTVGIQ